MKFVCDVMLGKLAKYLRLFGLDAVYARNDRTLRDSLDREPHRILLTRRRNIDVRSPVIRIKSEIIREQVLELRGVIKSAIGNKAVLNRCLECNVELIDAVREEIEDLVPEFVYHHYQKFKRCPSCKRIYWEGSHAKGMEQLIKEILA